MAESLQKKQAKLVLLLSTQSLKLVSKDDEKEQKEDKPKDHLCEASVQTRTNNNQEMEIEPIRIIAQDNVNDDADVVYVRTDCIAARNEHNTLNINTSVKTKPSQPSKPSTIASSCVLQLRSVPGQNKQKVVVTKKHKIMPVYSKIHQKEKEPIKKTIKRTYSSYPKPHPMICMSNEDRERIVAKYESGLKLKVISDVLNIPKQLVENVLLKYKRTGDATVSSRFKETSLSVDVMLSVQLWMNDDCNVSLTQLVEKVWTTYRVHVTNDSIVRTLIGFNYFFNRVQTIPKHKTANTTQEQIKQYATNFTTVPQSVSKLGIIFLDFVPLNVTFKASTKQRIQHKSIFIICAMNESGLLHYLTQHTNISMDSVTEFVYGMKNKLRELNVEESVVVIGSAANQRYAKLQDAIGYYKCNAMFLPSNATYLNPVEYMFKNFKRIIRRANPQTIEELMQAIESVPSLTRENDCKNWFELMWSYIPRCMDEKEIVDFNVLG